MVCKAILKPSIPFAAVSTAFMGMSIHKAKAAGITDTVLNPKGPLSLFQGGNNPLPPFSNPFSALHPALWDNVNLVFATLGKIIVFFQMLPQNMVYYTELLMGKLYECLVYLLQTPLFIFNATNIHNVSLVFSGISLMIVTILTMIEGNKKMLRKEHTNFKRICNRYFVALLGAGIAPILFEKSFEIINALTKAIAQIGSKSANTHIIMDTTLNSASAWLSALGLVAFDIMLIAMLIPVLLQNARRFFDLMVLAAITPLALTAWIFDDHRHMFKKWWFNVKRMSLTPLIYSIFVCLMGLLIFGTQTVTWSGLFIKAIIMIGGLSRMANPPTFVKSKMDDTKGDAEDSVWGVVDNFKKAYDTLTGKKFRTPKELVKRLKSKKGGTNK